MCKLTYLLASLLILLFENIVNAQPGKPDPNLVFGKSGYVWSFYQRNGERDELTHNLTIEFESELVKRNLFTVLNRRDFANLFEQWANEKAIQSITDLPDSTVNQFKIKKANFVVFGEVYQEAWNDSLRVTVKIEEFDSKILLAAYEDANLKKMNNIRYREAVINRLLDKIEHTLKPEKSVWEKTETIINKRRGIGVEYFQHALEGKTAGSYGNGYRISFQSKKRWGLGAGHYMFNDNSVVQKMNWISYSYMFPGKRRSHPDLILGIGAGNSYSHFHAYPGDTVYVNPEPSYILLVLDGKIRFKVFTFSMGCFVPEVIKLRGDTTGRPELQKVFPFVAVGLHVPF